MRSVESASAIRVRLTKEPLRCVRQRIACCTHQHISQGNLQILHAPSLHLIRQAFKEAISKEVVAVAWIHDGDCLIERRYFGCSLFYKAFITVSYEVMDETQRHRSQRW